MTDAAPQTSPNSPRPVSPIRDLRRRRRGYLEFYDQYDALIGLLCLSAHEGVKPPHEEEYRRRRGFFTRRYAALKPFLGCHLTPDMSDVAPIRQGVRSCDAFEALFLPLTIDAMLKADGGNLIGRMFRTQAALDAWDTALGKEETAHGIQPKPLPSPFHNKRTYRH